MTSMFIFLSTLAFNSNAALLHLKMGQILTLTLWITGFLCILNIVLAIRFRKRRFGEVLSYYTVFGVELVIFVFALLFFLKVITSVPYHLPPGLEFNRAEIGAAIAIGLGLFPAAYWHRTSLSELGKRIGQDAKTLKARNGGVHVRKSAPSEWMN